MSLFTESDFDVKIWNYDEMMSSGPKKASNPNKMQASLMGLSSMFAPAKQ